MDVCVDVCMYILVYGLLECTQVLYFAFCCGLSMIVEILKGSRWNFELRRLMWLACILHEVTRIGLN